MHPTVILFIIIKRHQTSGNLFLMRKYISFITLTLSIISYTAHANDTEYGDVNGTIRLMKQNHVSMVKERLIISQQRINVDYIFANHGKQDITIPIAFPMPPAQPSYYSGGPGITNFKLSVNGKPQKTQSRWIAVLADRQGKVFRDVTRQLAEQGWTIARLREVLESDDSFGRQEDMPVLAKEWFKNKDDNNYFHLTVQQLFVWQQTFPSGKEVIIHHAYTPSVTGGIQREVADVEEVLGKSCQTKNNRNHLNQMRHLLKERGQLPQFEWSIISYILTSGANWKDGIIDDFTLRIHKRTANDVAVVCFNHPLQPIDSLTLEFKQKNFKPEQNLDVTYYSISPK